MAGREIVDNLIDSVAGTLPYDLESEKAILALCLKGTDKIVDLLNGKLSTECFFDKRHQQIFDAISSLFIDNKKIDSYLVADYLTKKGLIEKAGGITYVTSLVDSYAISANANSYVDIVYEKYKLRNLIKVLEDMDKQAKSGKGSVNDVVDSAIARLSAMREREESDGFEDLGSIIKRNINELVRMKNGNDSGKIIKTGFRHLDRILGGFRPGTLNIIAARPGMGKTAFVVNIATNTASIYRNNVNIFSLEMSKEEIANRIISSRTATPSKKLQEANLTDEELFNITKRSQEIATLPIYIMDKSNVNPMSMTAECKKLQAENKLGLVIVDYLQLMSMPGNKGASYSRQNEISDISRSLKVLARELGVPVIALSQLSRGSVQRDDHTPQLQDLRDSGAIEQDADAVIFIDRDDYHSDTTRDNPVQDAKIIVAKNRHGETKNVYLKWEGARTLFYEPDRASDPTEDQVSPYAKTTSHAAASSDYNFDDSPLPEPPPMEDIPDPIPPMDSPVDSYDDSYAPPPMDDASIPPPQEDDMTFGDSGDDLLGGDFATDLPGSWG